MGRLTDAIKHLIIINIILFVAPQMMNINIAEYLALYFPKNESFGFWQYVTHMFLHGSFMHIAFNMYALWAFGTPLEQMWGKKKFLFFYFSAGLGAGIIYTLVNYYQFNSTYEQLINMGVSSTDIQRILDTGQYNDAVISLTNREMSEFWSLYHTPAVGASGAVYGILVAFGLSFPNAKLALIFFPVPVAAKYFIPLMLLGDLFFGVTKYSIGNIAHFAHIGGAIIGFIIAWYWKKNQFRMY
jgi:membrane associated rhomboid family serine protease